MATVVEAVITGTSHVNGHTAGVDGVELDGEEEVIVEVSPVNGVEAGIVVEDGVELETELVELLAELDIELETELVVEVACSVISKRYHNARSFLTVVGVLTEGSEVVCDCISEDYGRGNQ